MSAVEALEARLAADLGRGHCIAVGRGATAIWLAMEVLTAPGRRRVVLPATLCVSPPAVTALAGLEAVFCDVDPLTGNMSPDTLDACLRASDGVACVLAAHLYGQPAPIGELQAVCDRRGIPLIEDAAQAWGAIVEGRPAGAHGKVSIVSFGHTKILDAGGGGAALTDDKVLADRLREKAAALSEPPGELAKWAADYRQAYYAAAPEFNSFPQARETIREIATAHPQQYAYRLTDGQAKSILARLDDLPEALAHRRAMAGVYAAELKDSPATLMKTSSGGAPWRFNLLIPGGRRDEVAQALRAAGYDTSPWYPCVAGFFEDTRTWRSRWPGAARIEDEILNLWVDEGIDVSRVRGACAVIRDCLEGKQA